MTEEQKEFGEILNRHLQRYPGMQPQDAGKMAFQCEYGPEHMISDPGQVLRYLQEEWQGLHGRPPVPAEPVGGGLCRFHLTDEYTAETAAPLLGKLFLLTARERRGSGSAAGLLELLGAAAVSGLPGMEAWIRDYREKGMGAVHHSSRFRELYDPHYRLLLTQYAGFFPALYRLAALTGRKPGRRPLIAAIDGRCGSGKTSLAALISEVFPCLVLHMDDYYLPPPQRPADWARLPAANMDLQRFLTEALEPAAEGRPVLCRPYDCGSGTLGTAVTLAPKPLVIVEGSYSQHPLLAPFYDLRIFLSCSGSCQEKRLAAREGERLEAFRQRWIPLEEQYFRAFRIPESSSLILETDHFFP